MRTNILALCFIFCFSLLFTGCQEYSTKEEKILDIPIDSSISVENYLGDVTVRSWEKPQLKITATKVGWGGTEKEAARLAKEVAVKVSQQNSDIYIITEVPSGSVASGGVVDYLLEVPKEASVNIKSGGNIDIREIAGPVSLELSGLMDRKVTIEKIKGTLLLQAYKAKIMIREAEGDIELQADSGSVEMTRLKSSQLVVKTSNATISFSSNIRKDANYFFQSETGDIKIVLARSAKVKVIASTQTGTITCELPLEIETHTQQKLVGVLNYPAATLILETTSGNITIAKR